MLQRMLGWFAVILLCAAAYAADTRFYFVDVGHGNAAFVISPSGDTMLLDAGPTRAASRILKFMDENGIRKIDYLVVSHFEDDHMGAAPEMAKKTPIINFVDHGESVVYRKDDAWWKQRRGPWFREGLGKRYDESFEVYKAAREKSGHIAVKAGDRIPVKGLDAVVVSAAGKIIGKPLKGAGGAGPAACRAMDRRGDDDAEDGQSIGVVLASGKFRFVYLGDLTWNQANTLFCPANLVGSVDAYLVTHHAQSLPKSMGDYYYGLSCCSAAEVMGLNPRMAILSMGALGHKAGTPDAMLVLKETPGLQNLWQTEFIREGGEQGYNGPDDQIANLGQPGDRVPFIQLNARADGSFTAINSRNGYKKEYPARK
jgi:competence protein ComEC